MQSREWFDRQRRVADCRAAIAQMMLDHGEKHVDIWQAAFAHQMMRLSDWKLADDDGPVEQIDGSAEQG